MTLPDKTELPTSASFEEIAALLRQYDLDPNATGDSVRYRARTDELWPIGNEGSGKRYEYRRVGNARVMPPLPVLRLYEAHPRTGRRGPDKKPRKPKGQK
ncbi:hypothetical protein [Streptomyces lydicus]|uniref:hypothetical protein n=1 Tax=Streptomyces lydicus TaxID=47763 RepID=UPI0037BC91A8